MKRIYELALWNAGTKYDLGYFATKKEAEQAKRTAKKYYIADDEELQERIVIGVAGFEIIPHEWGMKGIVKAMIDYNRAKVEQTIEPKEV